MTTSRYGEAHQPAGRGGLVAEVHAGAAERAGVRPGERITHVDGQPLRDVIDWQWLSAEPSFTVRVVDPDGVPRTVEVKRDWDEPVGLHFSDVVFDGVRECENACAFCFVSQLPPGLRPSLYVRDDDYRLSFLSGNFVTLTNLADEDVERIIEQRLSPLYVSLHATDPEVRRSLVCPSVADTALERFDELLDGAIRLHVQIVLVPGVNDGAVLHRTLEWLAGRDGVESVGVVPLGYTKHQTRFTASFNDPEAAASVLDALEPWRTRMREGRGISWVHAADELYLAAGRDLPPAATYDGFPQYENGIGLVRSFEEEWTQALESLPESAVRAPMEVTLVTGELFAPVLARASAHASRAGIEVRVLPVRNDFFGGNVSVTGLLTAHDIVAAIRGDVSRTEIGGAPRGTYLVPDVVLNGDGLTLDDVPGSVLGISCDCDVRVVSSDAAELLAAMLALSDERP